MRQRVYTFRRIKSIAGSSALRKRTHLPISEVSEYLTSVEAREIARELKRKPAEPIDDLAARVILQSYLDAQSYS